MLAYSILRVSHARHLPIDLLARDFFFFGSRGYLRAPEGRAFALPFVGHFEISEETLLKVLADKLAAYCRGLLRNVLSLHLGVVQLRNLWLVGAIRGEYLQLFGRGRLLKRRGCFDVAQERWRGLQCADA